MRFPVAYVRLVCLAFIVSSALASAAANAGKRILIYTKNQTGTNLYVHDNIAASTAAIKKIATDNGLEVDVSDEPAAFTRSNLKRYKAVVFNNTNNEVLETEEQKAAFQEYIRSGGGFVGIHSASGSMRKWPWFWSMLGGKFKRHPKLQPFTVLVKDRTDISTAHLPESFVWTDEFYYQDNMPKDLHILLAGDVAKLVDPQKDQYPGKVAEFPLAWRQEFEGGRAWYTALGHTKEHYSDQRLMRHILGGILWVMGKEKP